MWADFVPPSRVELDLVPLFPIESFTPDVECPHHGPIRGDSSFICMVCDHASWDKERAIRRLSAIPPEEPEARLVRLKRLKAEGLLTDPEARLVDDLVARIEALVDRGPQPTSYTPTPGLKGGLG